MTKKQRFRNSIRIGTGEAYWILQADPKVDYTIEITRAASSGLPLDIEKEGSRAQYIVDLIDLSVKKSKVISTVVKTLQKGESSAQVYEIVAHYAGIDHIDKTIVYDIFTKDIENDCDYIAYKALIDMDGKAGLELIAKKIGKKLRKFPDREVRFDVLERYDAENSDFNIKEFLELASAENNDIKRFWKFYQEFLNKPDDATEWNYDSIRELMQTHALPAEIKDALSAEEIKKFADDFLAEVEEYNVDGYLNIFQHIKFPYEDKIDWLLSIAQERNEFNPEIVRSAVSALSYFKSDEIREFALSNLTESSRPEIYTDLLIKNYEDSDSKLFMYLVERTRNDRRLYFLAQSMLKIFNNNPGEECYDTLVELYLKVNSGITRNKIINVLNENNLLSDELKKEIKHDSYIINRSIL